MTLPASGRISLLDVMAELRIANPSRAFPIALSDADVRSLAGKPSGSIRLSDLYGKSVLVISVSSISDLRDTSTAAGTWLGDLVATVTGGGSGLTFSWSVVSNSGMNAPTLSSSSTQQIRKTYTRKQQGFFSITMSCTVTNSAGASRTAQGTASLELYNNS